MLEAGGANLDDPDICERDNVTSAAHLTSKELIVRPASFGSHFGNDKQSWHHQTVRPYGRIMNTADSCVSRSSSSMPMTRSFPGIGVYVGWTSSGTRSHLVPTEGKGSAAAAPSISRYTPGRLKRSWMVRSLRSHIYVANTYVHPLQDLERLGNPGWNWKSFLTAFRKVEGCAFRCIAVCKLMTSGLIQVCGTTEQCAREIRDHSRHREYRRKWCARVFFLHKTLLTFARRPCQDCVSRLDA